jgi:hypothetical protein
MYHHQTPALLSQYQYPPPQFFPQPQPLPDQFPEPELKAQFCGMFFAGSHLIASGIKLFVNIMFIYGILTSELEYSKLALICAFLSFLGSASETTFFVRVIFSSSYISGHPPLSRFGFLGFSLLSMIINIILMFSTNNFLLRVNGTYTILTTISKLIYYGIVLAIYGQDDNSNGSCCLCLKPWIQESPRIIQNYLINHLPPPLHPPPMQPLPIVYNSAIHPVPVAPVLSVNYLPNSCHKY